MVVSLSLIILEGDSNQLFFLIFFLGTFSKSIALKVNLKKSMMLPINMSEDRLEHLARTFGCTKGTVPFTYLWLPLGLTKPRIQDYLPLVNKCERRLTSVSTFLSQAGRNGSDQCSLHLTSNLLYVHPGPL